MKTKIINNGKKVDVGLTNDNYLYEKDNQLYMVRIPKKDVAHLFSRADEKIIVNNINQTDISIPIHYFDDTGIQMTPYLDDLITFDDYQKDDRIERVVTLMKRFHQLDIDVQHDFDAVKQLYTYYEMSETTFDLTPYQDLIDTVNKHQKQCEKILCHNDWVAGNICFVNDETLVIDFEYAGNNDPLFDVMSFYTENDLTDAEKIKYLQLHFPHGIDKQTMDTLIMYRDFNNLLWLMWAKMMYHLRSEPIYAEIIEIKLEQLTKEFNQPLTI